MAETTAAPAQSAVRGARRVAIIAIIVSLVIAALLGIVALLSGEFGTLQSRVMLTTLTVAAFGTTALCHLAVVTRAVRLVGFTGIIASAAAAVCAFVLIWVDWSFEDVDGWFRALAVLAIAAVSLAQVNLLLLLARRPHRAIRVALIVTLTMIALVAVLLWLPILSDGDIPGPDGDGYWRFLGVVAIVDALGTITLPILGLVLRRQSDAAPERGLELHLDADLGARLDAAAATAGTSREQAALAALERGLDSTR